MEFFNKQQIKNYNKKTAHKCKLPTNIAYKLDIFSTTAKTGHKRPTYIKIKIILYTNIDMYVININNINH